MGVLRDLGHDLSRNTIKRSLLDKGIDPAPVRGKRMPWMTFSRRTSAPSVDFFSVEGVGSTHESTWAFILLCAESTMRAVERGAWR